MEADEFDEFYAMSYARLCGQVYALIGDWDEATECVQEAFVRAWQHRRALRTDAVPEAWVRTTAHRLAISRWRRRIRGRRDPDRALGARTTAPGPSPDHVAVVEALKALPDAQRQALVLHYVCDLPLAEISRETGAPVGTVKARLSRGRAALLAGFGETPLSGSPEGAHHA